MLALGVLDSILTYFLRRLRACSSVWTMLYRLSERRRNRVKLGRYRDPKTWWKGRQPKNVVT